MGIILGSGLGALADGMEVLYTIPYEEIDGFPVSTVKGHRGVLIFGHLGGRNVVVMQGRFHYYEGYTAQEVTYPIRVMKSLGIRSLFISNAAGGLNPAFQAGDLMVINNHINFIPNPLIGKNEPEWGDRFPDMSEPYAKKILVRAFEIGRQEGIKLQQGCYVAVTGPSYETAAELKFFRLIGGDAVGMSTAPEVIAARHMGLCVFAVSVITNMVLPEAMLLTSHEEVMEVGRESSEKMTRLFTRMIAES